ncbi:dsDNA nuclease domain-containing protein [Vibrio cyclitrophicus]|uniref:dsDNA nuclease domain-containing protein n=1 Tax=Vibrio cyclitrophicus TaxID=47951 RepID=UPI0011B82805|nr:dsDNA nuclease domain-containing protein [Vibrio cyclitrophicus]
MAVNYTQVDSQDEYSGSDTFAKYWYQYNWALYQLLQSSTAYPSCMISIENHEDVMLIDSQCPNTSQVELYQVKEISGSSKNFTEKQITKKGKLGGNSILSKLVSNINKTNISNRLKKLSLVSSIPFKIKLKDEYSELKNIDEIKVNMICPNMILNFENTVFQEIEIEELPVFLTFFQSIKATDEQENSSLLLGELTKYIQNKQPGVPSVPYIIYHVIRAELVRIGTNKKTYLDWERFIENKTLSIDKVDQLIHTYNFDKGDFDRRWNSIIQELDIPFSQRIKKKSEFKEYVSEKLSSSSQVYSHLTNQVKKLISDSEENNFYDLITFITNKVDQKTIDFFDGDIDKIKIAITYETVDHI